MAGFHRALFICLIVIIGVIFAQLIEKPQCIHDERELWPHQDPNLYWFCDHKDAEPKPMRCAAGRGFLRVEDKVSGCVPWELWECTSKLGQPSCEGDNYFKPHRHVNPNKFWACTEDKPGDYRHPVEADCLDYPVSGDPPLKGTRGFVDNVDNLGCVPWDVWVCNKANDTTRQ